LGDAHNFHDACRCSCEQSGCCVLDGRCRACTGNSIGNAGAAAIAASLEKNASLKMLMISRACLYFGCTSVRGAVDVRRVVCLPDKRMCKLPTKNPRVVVIGLSVVVCVCGGGVV
jgi:hypothetical protein